MSITNALNQCGGERPCSTHCLIHGRECVYTTAVGETRNSALKRKYTSLEEELNALRKLFSLVQRSPPEEAYKIIAYTQQYQGPAESFQSSSSPSDAIGRAGAEELGAEIERPKRSTMDSGGTTLYGEADLCCFDNLLSWASCVPIQDRNHDISGDVASTSTLSMILSFPPLPLDAYVAQSETDTWTRTGWTKAHIRHLFGVLLTWDQLGFCLLCQDLLLQAYESGSREFCSSSLVNAKLALASRLVNETDEDDILPSGWLGSKYFYNEAKALLQDNMPSDSLPHIQTLGVLSLYEIRCGRQAEACEFAGSFLSKITKLLHEAMDERQREDSFIRARNNSFYGAVSLVRCAENSSLCVSTERH